MELPAKAIAAAEQGIKSADQEFSAQSNLNEAEVVDGDRKLPRVQSGALTYRAVPASVPRLAELRIF